MKSIRQVAASQRRHLRISAPLIIVVNGQEFSAPNWSMSGFRVEGFHEKVKPGAVLDVYLSLPFQGFNVGFSAKARVVYYDPSNGGLGAEFEKLDNRSQQALKTFVDGIIRGEMVSIDGVIKSLDIPVTPISLIQGNVSAASMAAAGRRRVTGVIGYILALLVLTAVIGVVVYTSFFQLKIDTAIVMGADDVINAPANGIITSLAKLDAPVAAGAPLVSIADAKLDFDINVASLNVEKAGAESRRVGSVFHANAASSDDGQDGAVFTMAASSKLVAAKAALSALKAQKEALTIFAPTDGHIVRIFAPLNSPAKFGAPVAVFERAEKPKIQAFLTQREALNIVKGQKAKAYLNDGSASFPVMVSDVDYYTLTLNQSQGHFQWQNLLNASFKTVIVVVEPMLDSDSARLSKIAPGAAATLVF